MNFILNVGDIDLILPTHQKKRSVLNLTIKELIMSTPGNALPDVAFEEANMPQLDSIIEESIVCSKTFLYADFTRDKAKPSDGKVPDERSPQEDSLSESITEIEEISELGERADKSANSQGKIKDVSNYPRRKRRKKGQEDKRCPPF